jgi:hypothetical protein
LEDIMSAQAGRVAKDACDHIPFAADQGMKNLVGAFARGVSVQTLAIAMPADGVITFADNDLSDMADGDYLIFIQNHTDVADEGTVSRAARLVTGFTIVGPDTADELDILVIGKLAGQLG